MIVSKKSKLPATKEFDMYLRGYAACNCCVVSMPLS